mmetsp:Transcript_30723/g.30220  ORF Transcript_30723/g.30220 Transcript_30723/m.30220 type:complete len:125 (+) Transcript_30723:995-1369(+)
MENEHDTIFDVRKGLRKHVMDQLDGLFYICVKGVMTSTYQLKVRDHENNKGNYTAQDGYSEYFFLRKDSFNSHIYAVPQLESSDEDIEIEAKVIVTKGGGSVSAYGRMCMQDEHSCRSKAEEDF